MTFKLAPCLLANFNSIVFDYCARQKIGGQTLNFFIVEQFPVLPPETYAESRRGIELSEFVKARVLELCYTAHDMRPLAESLGYSGQPFPWDEERRLHLRCQLDGLYFVLYGMDEADTLAILDTFPIIRRQDEARYNGRFRTRDLVVGYRRAYAAGNWDANVKG